MTQPIQEPSHDRSMQGANWGVRQLFRRPAQARGGTGDFLRLFSWNYWTSNTIPTTTWRYVANSTNESFYEEVVSAGMTSADADCSTGIIDLDSQAEYLITGWVQWNEDPEDGETRITALNFGSSDRIIEMYRFDAAMGSIAQLKLPVTAGKIAGSFGGVALEVWHNNSGSISIRDAEIAVYRIREVTDDNFEVCIT